MNKVYVIPNMLKEKANDVALKVCQYFVDNNYTVYIENESKSQLKGSILEKVSFIDEETALNLCDFVVAIGGDGTLLHAVPNAARHQKPILGVNNGKLGFMTEIDATQLNMLDGIKNGLFQLEERMLLKVIVIDKNGDLKLKETFLNDIVVTKGAFSRLVDIDLSVDGKPTMAFRGDGIIVSTPTGTTGYSLSAGGPIIEPNAKCIAVTPICPHALTIKSFVLSSDRTVEICEDTTDKSRFISVDGKEHIELDSGDVVKIFSANEVIKMIRVTNQGFYDRINGKLVKEVL